MGGKNMEDTINLVDAAVAGDSEPTAEVTTESQLSEEIGELWLVHIQRRAPSAARKQNSERSGWTSGRDSLK
jgi:hypothetical protein